MFKKFDQHFIHSLNLQEITYCLIGFQHIKASNHPFVLHLKTALSFVLQKIKPEDLIHFDKTQLMFFYQALNFSGLYNFLEKATVGALDSYIFIQEKRVISEQHFFDEAIKILSEKSVEKLTLNTSTDGFVQEISFEYKGKKYNLELDNFDHLFPIQQSYDRLRDALLKNQGFEVRRISLVNKSNQGVNNISEEEMKQQILDWVDEIAKHADADIPKKETVAFKSSKDEASDSEEEEGFIGYDDEI
jgi:hypothetical protein